MNIIELENKIDVLDEALENAIERWHEYEQISLILAHSIIEQISVEEAEKQIKFPNKEWQKKIDKENIQSWYLITINGKDINVSKRKIKELGLDKKLDIDIKPYKQLSALQYLNEMRKTYENL